MVFCASLLKAIGTGLIHGSRSNTFVVAQLVRPKRMIVGVEVLMHRRLGPIQISDCHTMRDAQRSMDNCTKSADRKAFDMMQRYRKQCAGVDEFVCYVCERQHVGRRRGWNDPLRKAGTAPVCTGHKRVIRLSTGISNKSTPQSLVHQQDALMFVVRSRFCCWRKIPIVRRSYGTSRMDGRDYAVGVLPDDSIPELIVHRRPLRH